MGSLDSYRQKAQRGTNLVEMLIVLTVLGLVIGGALIPLQQRLKHGEVEEASALLAEAKEAVYVYALKNTTRGSRLVYYDGSEHPLPAGRPYLPCPDITGDGLEDRTPLPTGYPVTLSLSFGGGCQQLKGMLPWKTLGVRELDPWGNRLTYRVDRKFSNRLLGFDESFHADIFNINASLTVDASGDAFYDTYADRNDAAAVVCSDLYDGSGGGCPKTDLSNITSGVVSTATVTLGARLVPGYDDVAATAPLQGIISGAVFVIVSHGRDGAGAINRLGRCQAAPRLSNNLVESANAYYRAGHPLRSAPFLCTPAAATVLSENLFVSAPLSDIVNDDVDAPDDILVWGGNDLHGYLAASGVLPLARLGYLPPQ